MIRARKFGCTTSGNMGNSLAWNGRVEVAGEVAEEVGIAAFLLEVSSMGMVSGLMIDTYSVIFVDVYLRLLLVDSWEMFIFQIR